MTPLPRRLAAEFTGTFALVFFGAAAGIADAYPSAKWGIMGVALAHAVVLSVRVSAFMNVSGGQFNPALTIGLASTGRMTPKDAGAYVGTQLLAAVVAGLALKLFYPAGVAKFVSWGTPSVSSSISLVQAIGVEALLTFFLVTAVYATAVAPSAPPIGGFGIGLTLFFCILAGAPLTGAALNPARAFGPAVVAPQWVGHAVYWIGPIIGAVLAAQLWERMLMPKEVRTA